MAHPNISINVLAYRSIATIRRCVASVLGQDFSGPLSLRVREQGGDDAEFALLKKLELGSGAHRRLLVSRGENLGFAAGHNMLIREALDPQQDGPADFILCLNADAALAPNFLTEAVPPFQHERVGAIQGKLLRWDVAGESTGPPLIDTTGLLPLRNRRILNRGQGEKDRGQYETVENIFGPDGAAPLYRSTALEDTMIPFSAFRKEGSSDGHRSAQSANRIKDSGRIGEYFDEDFFMYKEDVDLAWRLQWRGWKTMYVPEAIAWHARGSGDSAAHSPVNIIRERRKLSPTAKYYAFANQRLLQIKNETRGGLLRDFFPWYAKEAGAWWFALLTERKTLPAILRVARFLPKMLKKRRWIMAHRKPDANPYTWFT